LPGRAAEPPAPSPRPPPGPPPGDHRPLAEHLEEPAEHLEEPVDYLEEPVDYLEEPVDYLEEPDAPLPMSSEPASGRGRDSWPDGEGVGEVESDATGGRLGGNGGDDDFDFDDILARLETQERERAGREVGGSESDGPSDDLFGDDDELPGVLRGRLREGPQGRSRLRPPAWASWAMAGLVIVTGTLGGLYFLRDTVVGVMPQAEGIYDSLGIPLNRPGRGLWLRELGSTREMVQGEEVLVVRGFITNVTETERAVPALRLTLNDNRGKLVQQKTDAPPKDTLAPGETTPYQIVMRDRLPEGVGIQIAFVERPAEPILTPPPR